jgi:16S rRNA (guanine527-N7)-methyltransferase
MLKDILQTMGFSPTDTQIEQFSVYSDVLISYNEKVNLTAITKPPEIDIKHFADSLELLTRCEIPLNATVADIGTGAGFPGVPLLIMRQDLHLTLIEGNNKRVEFLKFLREKLSLSFEIIQMRAEEIKNKPQLRERFDIVTARAVAALPALTEYCLPYVTIGGFFLPLKGGNEEYTAARGTVTKCGGELIEIISYNLPGGDARKIFKIKKIKPTPKIYPRENAAILKKPL